MPMRKHEMVYVFYEKLPLYDLSSHKHKFIKETVNKRNGKDGVDNKEPNTINTLYGDEVEVPDYVNKRNKKTGMSAYEPPLPVSVVKEDYETCNKPKRKMIYGNMEVFEPKRRGEPRYDPPLPTTMLEIKSTKGKHSTQKPVELMEWLLKYFSKEGDTVLDPTMGSGSTGVACKNMNRNFIGIELDPEIYEVAVNRIEE
jgi:DNA modification methylase